MIRRIALAAGALAAAASFSSCSTFSRSDTAAEMKGEQLTRTQLNVLAENNHNGDSVRKVLTQWVTLGLLGGDLHGLTTAAELETRVLAAESAIGSAHLAEAQQTYEKGLAGSPALCLAAIPLKANTAADSVLADLKSGTTFADAAKKYSSDPTFAANGGIVTDQSNAECYGPATVPATLITALGNAGAVVGTPVAVNLNNTDFIMLLRPFAELSKNDQISFAQPQIATEVQTRVAATPVYVNSRYGRWDTKLLTVVALGNG